MPDHAPVGLEAEHVTEVLDAAVPALVHPGWEERFPSVVQGTTTRGPGGRAFDLGLFSDATPGHVVHGHWNRLLASTGMARAVHAKQPHETDVLLHRSVDPGLSITDACDGHVTSEAGVLLAVTVADCVPVFAIAPDSRAVGVIHAGWRGVAAGVLERGLAVLAEAGSVLMTDLFVHLGPSICGACYEVGPEVFRALGQPVPDALMPIDLRGVLGRRAAVAGIPNEQITVSTHCTRCTGSDLFSHRAGDGERQVGYMGIRA